MSEPSSVRDVGPYRSESQVLAQVSAQTFGIPQLTADRALDLLLGEGLLLGGVEPSDFELEQIRDLLAGIEGVDVLGAQIISGWVLRAHMAGVRSARAEGDS